MFKKKLKIKNGFSLVEVLIFLCIFVITAVTFYKVITFSTITILESKNRVAAIEVANEKMEIIRSLPYNSIGTVLGIPHGDISDSETITKNTKTFFVCTFAKYTDDSSDNLATDTPADLIPTDYKDVRVQISWDPTCNSCLSECLKSKTVYLNSRFVPPGMETIGLGGILSLNVQDNTGSPIDGANVRLKNTVTGVDSTYQTDAGNAMFFEVPEDIASNYRITVWGNVTGGSLFGVHTYSVYNALTPGSFDPADRDTSVTNGTMWTTTITTDLASTLEVQTKDLLDNSVPNVVFSLEGGRVMGAVDNVAIPPVPVYSYPHTNLNSGATGKIEITSPDKISSGNYTLIPTVPVGYKFVKMQSATNDAGKFMLNPGTDLQAVALFAKTSDNALWITVKKKSDGTPIQGASVQVKNLALSFDQTINTDVFGNAIFTNGIVPLTADAYEVLVSAAGFTSQTESKTVSGLSEFTFELE